MEESGYPGPNVEGGVGCRHKSSWGRLTGGVENILASPVTEDIGLYHPLLFKGHALCRNAILGFIHATCVPVRLRFGDV